MKRFCLMLTLFLMHFASCLNAQQTALKTNILWWGTTTPNVGVEVGLSNHFTLDIWGAYNAWKFSNDMKLNLYLIQPEARYWPCQKFEGHFFGVHGHFGHYNIGQIPFISGMKEYLYRGDLYGGGVSYGYHWALGERWGIEATIGAGYAYLKYDKLRCTDCAEPLYPQFYRSHPRGRFHYLPFTLTPSAVMKKNNTYISSQVPGMWTSVASHINTAFWESTVCTSPLERGLGGVLFPPAQAFSHQWVTVGRDNTPLPLSRGEAQAALSHRSALMAQPVGGKEAGCKKRKGRRIGTYILLLVSWIILLGHFTAAHAEGIRIRPESVKVENDSLRIHLLMDLSSVKVASGEAYIFTPFLRGDKIHLALPPVIVTGSRRARFDRRERALSSDREAVEPYRIIVDNRKRPSQEITYRLSIPYASWMLHAGLALMQENKTCCVKRILSVDTLTPDIAAAGSPAEESVIPHAQPKPLSPVAAASERVTAEILAPSSVLAPLAVSPAVRSYVMPSVVASNYLSMVSYLEPLMDGKEKSRTKGAVLYIDYPLNKYEVYLDYKNNRREVDKIDSLLTPVLTNGFSIIRSIRIRGYASPDGNYGDNERLSSHRSRRFMYYVRDAYSIPEKLFDVSWVAEDWEGTEELLNKFKPSYYRAALDIIHRYGIFQGREKQLMDLQGGAPYKDMLKTIFPLLRRIEVVLQYDVRKVAVDEAVDLIYTHPELLSLEEMYSVAKYYRPGTEQYREIYEIAAFHFPDDIVANVNASSAVMLTGDIQSAWNYLRKVDGSPKAWNNMGVLTLMEGNPEGAAQWFRKAVGVEPQKARNNLQLVEGMLRQSRQGEGIR